MGGHQTGGRGQQKKCVYELCVEKKDVVDGKKPTANVSRKKKKVWFNRVVNQVGVVYCVPSSTVYNIATPRTGG